MSEKNNMMRLFWARKEMIEKVGACLVLLNALGFDESEKRQFLSDALEDGICKYNFMKGNHGNKEED